MYNIKKLLMTISITLAFSCSLISTGAYAASNKTSSDVSSESSQKTDDKNSTSNINKKTSKTDVTEDKKDQGTSTNKNENMVDLGEEDKTGIKDDENVEVNVVPHWENIDGKLYYVTKDGIVEEEGWFKEKDENPDANNDNEYYLDKNHSAVIGWNKIGGQWYYFNETGVKQTGWQLINYEWYHLDKNGMMEKGWIKDDGNKYYLSDSGIMVVGKKYIDDKWYLFASDGKLQTGFYTYNGKDYYSDKDGVMVTNQWIKTKKNEYYAKADGSIAKGNIVIDGKPYVFDNNGHFVKSGNDDANNYLYVNYLSVGNADCQFIRLPNGETALIDTGDVTTRNQLVNFLNEQKLKKKDGKKLIDYVIITHGHSDHIGGLTAVLDNFEVGKIYMPQNTAMKNWYSGLKINDNVSQEDIDMLKYDYEVYKDAVKAVKEKKLKFIDPQPGQYIDSNKILQFVQSGKDFGPVGSQEHLAEYWGINDNSAIVYLNYGDFQGLFTADIEWNAEKDFWINNILHGKEVDLLKVPHHGYNTSSTEDFLKYVNAPVGIISRAEDSIDKNTAFNNLVNNGVMIYETSQTKNDGISVYATEDNWSMEYSNKDK